MQGECMYSDIQQTTNPMQHSHNSYSQHARHQHDRTATFLLAPHFPVSKAITIYVRRSNTHHYLCLDENQ